MRKANKLKYLLLLATMFVIAIAKAQNPIVIQSILAPPYPVYYTDITEMPGLASIVVQNTDLNNSYTIRFKMKLDGGNGIRIQLNEDVIPSSPITIGPGEVKVLTSDDLTMMYNGISINDITLEGIDATKMVQSQRIPDGVYKLCVQAFDNEYVKPLSGSSPTGCSNKMFITTLEPPTILSPIQDAEIEYSDPQQILIRWTAVNSPTSAMLYDIRIAEVPEGISPYEAVQTDNLLFFEEIDYPATIFNYGPTFPALISGKKYALQITAHSPENNANIRNDGKSDVVSFRYKNPNKIMPPTFNCNGPCMTPPIPTSKIPLANLVAGDNVRIGHFHMTVLNAQKVGVKFKGEAILNTSSFFTIPILVEFKDLIINSNYEVTGGTALAKQKNELSSISCYQDAEGFVPQSDQDMAEIYDAIINPSSTITTYMNSAPASSVYSGVNLPVGYGDNGKEMVIIGMYFKHTGATMNLVSGYQMAGDANTGVINLIYGTNNICISPGGPTSGAGTNDIVLLNAVDFHPNANMTVRFEPGNVGANTGCWARFNCSGITEYYIRGAIKLDNGSILPEDAAGNLISNKSLGVSFSVTSLNPYNWVAPLTFSGTTTIPNVEITPHMRVLALPDHSFTIHKMYYDNSLTRNPPDIRFSEEDIDALGNVNSWQGLYIKEFSLLMPNYFNEDDSVKLAVNGNNFINDANGYSFSVVGKNLLNQNQMGSFDGNDFTISTYKVRVVHSNLQFCSLTGKIKLDIADGFVHYRGAMNVNNNQPNYFLSINPGQGFNVDMWKARMSLDSNSLVWGYKLGNAFYAEANLSGKLTLNESIDGINWIDISGIQFKELKAYSHQPYFKGGHFDLVGDHGHKFGGFDILIDSIGVESLNPDNGNYAKEAIAFNFRFDLSSNTNEFSADARIRLIGKKETDDSDWAFDSIQVGRINIAGESPLVEIEGTLDWYQNHPIYKNGYRGDIVAYFFDDRDFMVESEALFGSTDKYDYYYIDGATIFRTDIPMIEALAIRGFGGGVYNNMRADGEYTPMRLATRNENPDYTPVKKGKGFKAMVVMATPLDETIFNGITQIEVDYTNGSVERFGFNGNFGILRNLPMGEHADYTKPMISASGRIDMHGSTNAAERYLSANLSYEMNIPKNPSILYGTGNLSYYTGSDGWYLRIGEPSRTGEVTRDMISTHIGFRYKLFGKTFELSQSMHSYFDFGTMLPPMARYPNYVPQSIRNMGIRRVNPSLEGSGAMMGIHQNFGMPRKKAFTVMGCGVKFRADAGFGLDLALIHKNGALCNGNVDFGINKWRADGQGYFYAIADLDGSIVGKSFKIAKKEMGASMKAILPEPMYFGAGISATIGLPVYGNYTLRTSYRTGTTCEYTMDPAFTQQIALTMEDLITDISLSPSDNDSVYALDDKRYVEVKMGIPVGRVTSIDMADGTTLKTRVMFQAVLYEKLNDAETKYVKSTPEKYIVSSNNDPYDSLKTSGNSNSIKIYFTDNLGNAILKSNKSYTVRLKATVMYAFDNDRYTELKDDEGKVVSESKHIRFVTQKEDPKVIANVIRANPAINQRFFYIGENTAENALFIEYADENVFAGYGNRSNIKIEFKDVVTENIYTSMATKVNNQNKLIYNLPRSVQNIAGHRTTLPLKNGKIYQVKVFVRAHSDDDLGEYREVLEYYFRASEYNTYDDKLDDIKISYRIYNSNIPTRKYMKLKLNCLEGFGEDETLHLNFESFNSVIGHEHPWSTQYDDLTSYSYEHNIRIPASIREFSINTTRYQKLGDLTQAEIDQAIWDSDMGISPSADRQVQLEYNWNLNEHLFAYWKAVRDYKIAFYGKSNNLSKMPMYQTSPNLGMVNLKINYQRNASFTLTMMNY